MRIRRAYWVGLAALGAVAVLAVARTAPSQQLAADLPTDLFRPPTGPWAVGTREWLWVDSARPERYTRDPSDVRRLLVQAWYPAAPEPGNERSPYVRTPAEFGRGSVYRRAGHVRTNAFSDAAVSESGEGFPVLLYNHGAGWSRFTGTFIAEELASHGYVVFSIEHPGRNRTVLYPDGRTFRQDTVPDQPDLDAIADPQARAAAARDFVNGVLFPIWIEDSRFALDRIAGLNTAPGPFRGRLDPDRVGMLGWSFGGATAVEMSRIDPRVRVAVNHDGGLYGGVRTESTGRPFLMFRHGVEEAEAGIDKSGIDTRETVRIMLAYDSVAEALAGADWFDIRIEGTNHASFSDVALLVPWDPALLPARRGHEIIAAYTLAFFDRYLKGAAAPLLDRSPSPFAEVTLRRN